MLGDIGQFFFGKDCFSFSLVPNIIVLQILDVFYNGGKPQQKTMSGKQITPVLVQIHTKKILLYVSVHPRQVRRQHRHQYRQHQVSQLPLWVMTNKIVN